MRKMKIAILGPHGAGKSTLVRKLDPDAIAIKYPKDNISPTIGFDYGVVLWDMTASSLFRRREIDKLDFTNEIWKVTLVSTTPGQTSLAPLKATLGNRVDGIILVLDSSNPSQFVYGLAQYEEIRDFFGKDKPLLILANKWDLRTDKSPAIPKYAFKEMIEIKPISILKGPDVIDIVLKFFGVVRNNILRRSIQRMVSAIYQETNSNEQKNKAKKVITA